MVDSIDKSAKKLGELLEIQTKVDQTIENSLNNAVERAKNIQQELAK